MSRAEQIQRFVVTAQQMRTIEEGVFAAGMPVAALMEKVAGLITQRIETLFPRSQAQRVGVLVGPGHNGGDALVVARELKLKGYEVLIHCPFNRLKELTDSHARYARSLGIPFGDQVSALQACKFLIDGLFGFGLERSLEGRIADLVDRVNQWPQPVVSIDLPSGLHTDTGEVLGAAIRADLTLCLGLWKQGLLQEHALEWIGETELIDFGLPLADIQRVLGEFPLLQRTTPDWALAHLPLRRPATTHKYKMGHLLAICGSNRYAGGALLTGLGARASGVGMLTIAVPESLKPLLVAQLPEALVLGCLETFDGAIAQLPDGVMLDSFDAIACGPGLTRSARAVVQQVLASDRPLVLDADGLNILADQGAAPTLTPRTAPTILTPHLGEFKRLFPGPVGVGPCRVEMTRQAAYQSGAIVLLKGARVTIAQADGQVRITPRSTPALARGGSGDVLTGLMGGLLAQAMTAATSSPLEVAQAAAWWHAQAGILASQQRTELGVDAFTLTQFLIPALKSQLQS